MAGENRRTTRSVVVQNPTCSVAGVCRRGRRPRPDVRPGPWGLRRPALTGEPTGVVAGRCLSPLAVARVECLSGRLKDADQVSDLPFQRGQSSEDGLRVTEHPRVPREGRVVLDLGRPDGWFAAARRGFPFCRRAPRWQFGRWAFRWRRLSGAGVVGVEQRGGQSSTVAHLQALLLRPCPYLADVLRCHAGSVPGSPTGRSRYLFSTGRKKATEPGAAKSGSSIRQPPGTRPSSLSDRPGNAPRSRTLAAPAGDS